MMKKLLSLVLISILCLSLSVSAFAEYAIDSDGNASCESALGFTFKIDDLNGEITGEDSTVVTTDAGVMGIGSKWATWFMAEKVSDGVYKAVTDGAAMGGNALDMTLSEGQILVVVHSSSSRPSEADKYPNWESKVVARAVKKGDFLVFSDGINLEDGTGSGFMKVVTEEEANSGNVEFSEAPDEPAADESVEGENTSEPEEESMYIDYAPSDVVKSESEVVKIPLGDHDKTSLDTLWLVLGTILLCAGIVVIVLIIVWKPKKSDPKPENKEE